MRKKLAFAHAWLCRICPLVLAILLFAPQAHAWWDTNWNKLRPVDITWSGSTQTNFQIKVDVTYDADMQADFDDIRFVDSDDLTPLDYWREEYTASTSATFWVEVPSIAADKTIYMYYANAGVSTTSSGSATFEYFEDFEGMTTGSVDAQNSWESPDPNRSGSAVSEVKGSNAYQGTKQLETGKTSSGTYSSRLVSLGLGNGRMLEFMVNCVDMGPNSGSDTKLAIFDNDGQDVRIATRPASHPSNWITQYPSAAESYPQAVSEGTWERVRIGITTSNNLFYYLGGTTVYNNVSQNFDSFDKFEWYADGKAYARYDQAFIRKFAGATEPSNSVGAEQGQPPAGISTNYRSIGTNTGTLYAVGDASITSGTTTVTFDAGASLPVPTAEGAVGQGDKLVIGGETFFILSRDSATQVTVQTAAAATHSNAAYTITRAYNKLQDWEDDCAVVPGCLPTSAGGRGGNLVADDRYEIGVAYNDAGSGAFIDNDADGKVLIILGSTVDATRHRDLTVAVGQRHNGTAGTGAVIDGQTTSAFTVTVRESDTRLEWFEIKNGYDTANAGSVSVYVTDSATNVIFEYLLVYDYANAGKSNTGARTNGNTGSESFTVRNSIFYNGNNGVRSSEAVDSVTVENSTSYNMSKYGYESKNSGVLSLTNSIAILSSTADFSAGITGNYNLDADSSAPGANSLHGMTAANQFVNISAGTENLHLKAGADAIDAGTDLSGSFTDDIDAETRPGGAQWDIGADETGAAAPAVTSAAAEISPNDVTTSSTANAFSYDIEATISGSDTGVNSVAITVPASFGAPTVTDVLVGGVSVGPAGYTDNTVANDISVDLTTKVTTSDRITVLFDADAPTTQDLTGVDFTSTVDDSGTGDAAQSTTEGNGDGDAGDANSWTVTTTDAPAGFSTNYRSVGTNAGTLYSLGDASITSGTTTVTFGAGASLPVPTAVGAVGQGDVLVIAAETFHILSRDSATQVTVQTAAAATHSNAAYTITRAYNTLQAWEDNCAVVPGCLPTSAGGRGGDLVADDRYEVGVAYHDAGSGAFIDNDADGRVVDISGSTVDATRHRDLTVAVGQRHNGTAGTGALVDGQTTTAYPIQVRESDTRVDWFEVKNGYDTADIGSSSLYVGDGANTITNVVLENMLVYDYAAAGAFNAGARPNSNFGTNSFTVRNSIFYNGNYAVRSLQAIDSVTVENCTSYNMSRIGYQINGGGVMSVTNSIATLSTTADFTAGITGNYNLDADGSSAPGANSLHGMTAANQFVSIAAGSEDLHLKAGANAINAGTDLSGSFTGDIDGDTRPIAGTWEIGADETSAPGTPAVTSAVAEISPNDVTTSSTGNSFSYDIQATIGGSDTGVNRVTVTVPGSFGAPTITAVRVDDVVAAYTNNTSGNAISVDLTTKVTASSKITIVFDADAPTTQDLTGANFLSTVDDWGTGDAAQSTTEGNGDGDVGDNNSWTVTTTDAAAGVPTNYRSIGTNTGTLYAVGDASITSGTTTVTFAGGASLPVPTATGAVGQGDNLVIGGETFFVLSRDSATQVTVQTAAAATQSNAAYTITRAYNTLQDWEDDCAVVPGCLPTSAGGRGGNLVADDRYEIGVAYDDAGSGAFIDDDADGRVVDISGSTVDTTRHRDLTVAVGQRHNGTAGSGAVIDGQTTVAFIVTVRESDTRVEWFEIKNGYDTANAGSASVYVTDSATNVIFEYLLVYDYASAGQSNTGARPNSNVGNESFTVRNSIFYNGNNGVTSTDAGDTVTVENCTSYNMSKTTYLAKNGAVISVTNSIGILSSTADFSAGVTGNYNLDSDSSAPGANSLHGMTAANQFVSIGAGSENLHLKAGADGIDAGTDLSGSFTDDIDAETRPGGAQWDIGADETNAGGATPAVTSAVAEISPNDVTTSSTGNAFSYDIQATIMGGDTGVNTVAITVPASFGVPTVTDVLVDSLSVPYTDNTSGSAISVVLTSKVTTSSRITVLFSADAPTTQDLTGVDFVSTVDDNGTGDAAQATTEGNGDADVGDNNSWTVTTTNGGGGGPVNPVVNSTGDAADNNAGNGVCDTGGLNSQSATECTLRAAIQEANASTGLDTIAFNMPTTESGYSAAPLSYTITPASAMTTITEQVVIDATSQTGYSGTPIIVLDGNNLAASGLTLGGTGDNSTIRGFVIRDFGSNGIHIEAASDGHLIAGNYIGRLNVSGTDAGVGEENAGRGIEVLGSSSTIGGTTAADRNVISGGGGEGIIIRSGAANNIVRGNYIGVQADGTTPLGNDQEAIQVDNGSPGTIIGGSAAGAGNVIGANGISSGAAISIGGDGSDNTVVQGNYIGTDAGGTLDLGNLRSGVEVRGTSNAATSPLNTLIGGTGAGEANVIRFNDLDGVRIRNIAVDVAILGNAIDRNDQQGIDLWADTSNDNVTSNDSNDADSGSNHLMNFPVITSAIWNAGSVDVNIDVDVPAGNYRVEFFRNPTSVDPSGNGEGEVYMDFVNITHGGSGSESFLTSFSGSLGDVLSATATEELSGPTFVNTSEFSATYTVTAGAAVSAAVAEISPNDVTTNAGAYAFAYDINATIGTANTGVDRIVITVPGTFGVNASPVTNLLVDGATVAFTDNTVGNAISVDLTTKVTTSARITVLFNADAPGTEDLTGVDFTSTVDDSVTGDAAQATTEGNGDGDTTDLDSWTVTTTDLPTGGGGGACTITADGAASTGSTTGTSITISHTTSAGSDRLMLVGVSINNDDFETVTSVTYNSVALTFVGTIAQSDDARVEIWQLTETNGLPTGGPYNVVITFSADLKQSAIAGVMTFTGVDQTTPLGTFASNKNVSSSSASVTVSSAVDELVFALMSGETVTSITTNAPATERWNLSLQPGGGEEFGAGATDDGAASVTMTWSLGSSDHWSAAGISIKPAQNCGAVDHFSIVDNGNTSCTAETVTIDAHTSGHSVVTGYTGLVRLTTSTGNGDWAIVSGAGTLNASGNGNATYFYDAADLGSVQLALLNTNVETVNVDATNGSASEDAGEDPDLVFTTSGGTTTFRDEFNNVALNGSDGTGSWATDWIEIGETDGINTGDLMIRSESSNYQLRIKDNDGGGVGIQREVDLSGFTSATLSFEYKRLDMDAGDDVWVQVSNNGGSSWTTLDTFSGVGTDAGDDASYVPVNYDITAYLAVNTRIRLLGDSGLGNNDIIHFDDVEISADSGASCGGATIDHFSISHDGTAINCQAEPVTITAHNGSHSVITSYTGVLALSTSTSHGDWSVITGSGTAANSSSGAGSYAFDATDLGSVVLGLRDTFVETTNIDVTDGISIEDASEDPNLVFARAGFNFLADSTMNTIGVQIGGKASNVAPGAQTLELQAVNTSDDTGACEAALTGTTTIEIGFECEDPSACSASQLSFSGTNLPDSANNAVLSYTGISMDFGTSADSTASFTMSYPDVGKVQLHARTRLMPSGEAMLGGSNSFVVRPFAFDLTATGNPAATGPADPVFTSAGTDFTADVTALLWEAGDDLDNDGIADNHDDSDPSNNADLTDNAAALNYGNEYAVEQVLLTAALDQPTGGANPGLSGGTGVTVFTSGTGTTTTVRYDEVGIIEMTAAVSDNDYLGIGATETAKITSKSGFVGRFNPAQYAVTASAINPACSATFTYARQPFTGSMTIEAQNGTAGGNTRTQNFRAGFVTLDPNSELTFINSVTTGAYNFKSVSYNQNFDSGNYGEAVLALQFRWDMAEQVPTTSTVQNTAVTDEVTTLAAAPVSIGSSPTRFGRAAFGSAVGSELINLGVPFHTEYYVTSNTGYVTNVDDFCSTGASLSFSSFAGNLGVGETCVEDSGAPGVSGAGCLVAGPVAQRYDDPLIAGEFNLFLDAPGAGNDGSGTVDANVPDWLEFDWDTGLPGIEDPSGRFTFGIYGGDKNQVFRRELY